MWGILEHDVIMKVKPFFPIPLLVLALIFISFHKNDAARDHEDPFVVVLDAGHGGHDPGNLGNGYLEKNIALNIVLKAGEILERNSNIQVIYTRKDDTFVDLYVRGEIANKANADLFVSVHCDSHSSDAYGAGTFVLGLHANKQNFEIAKKENSVIYLEDNYETRYADYDINSPESVIGLTIMQEEFLDKSVLLAKIMQEKFSKNLKRNDRKVKQAGFIVLHQTFMPSVLVETGFLTNKSEGAYLNSQKGQSEMGKAIADAILKYKENVEANVADYSAAIQEAPSPDESMKEDEVAQVEVQKSVQNASDTNLSGSSGTTAKKLEELVEPKPKEAKSPTTIEDVPKTVNLPKNIPEPKKSVVPTKKEIMASKSEKKASEPKANIIFKVQLLASSKALSTSPSNFKGLGTISKEPYGGLFRYLYGSTNSYKAAELLKSNADLKGYDTSFIVAYKDGKRISVPEALKYVSE